MSVHTKNSTDAAQKSRLNNVGGHTKTRPALRNLIGYTRVSTPRQATGGFSLDSQADQIRGYAERHRYALKGIYEDVGSASRGGIGKDLGNAISEALRLDAPLCVASISRLSRRTKVFREIIAKGPKIICVETGRVSKLQLLDLGAKAEADALLHSQRQKLAMDQKRARGEPFGNLTSLPEASRKGCLSNMVRSEQKVKSIADYLEKTPGAIDLSHRALADALNRAGLLNLKSEKNGQRKSWTAMSIRKPREKAMKLLEQRRDLEAEEKTVTGVHPAKLVATASPMSQIVTSKISVPGRSVQEGVFSAKQDTIVPTVTATSSTATPVMVTKKRALTSEEIARLKKIMSHRALSQSDVMDELGLARLNPSIWLAVRQTNERVA